MLAKSVEGLRLSFCDRRLSQLPLLWPAVPLGKLTDVRQIQKKTVHGVNGDHEILLTNSQHSGDLSG